MFGLLPLLLLFAIFLPLFFFMAYFNLVTFSFAKLGLSAEAAVFLVIMSLIGSVVNLPLSRKRYRAEEAVVMPFSRFPFIFYEPPRVREQVIAINVGGAVIPVLIGLYLLSKAPLLATILATILVAWICHRMARLVPGRGIVMPAFIPPIIAALAAILLAPGNPAPVAYIAGAWGTLIGADLLNLQRLEGLGAQLVSIGGAGIYDGIFLVSFIAALLS